MRILKPAPWPIQPALIAPQHQMAWLAGGEQGAGGLESVWPLWERGGTTIYPAPSMGHASIGGTFPTWTNFGLNFDQASSEYVSLDPFDRIATVNSHSIMVVFRTSATAQATLYSEMDFAGDHNSVCMLQVHGDQTPAYVRYFLRGTSSSTLRRQITTNTTSGEDYADGEWHVVIVSMHRQNLGGTTPNFVGYIDGRNVFDTFDCTATPPTARVVDSMAIGALAWDPIAEFYDGDIALVTTWGRSLSIGEIKLLSADPFGLLRPVTRITDRYLPPIITLPPAGQIGLPWGVTGNPDAWKDELGNTSDAELINSVDEGEPFAAADYVTSP
ncbi:MAG: LamG-like jellyroll fold domain-containing protein [Planctomycetota bacterium]